MWKFFVSILFLVSVSWGFAQNPNDTATMRPPKPPKVKKEFKEFIPTGVMVGVDIYSPGREIWEPELKLREFQADIDFRHYSLALGYGTAEIFREEEGFQYRNEGSFWRINAEVNFIYGDHQSRLFAGLGFARSSFDDFFRFDTQDAFNNSFIEASNQNASARWFELTTGTKIKVWKNFYMGYTVRYKFLKRVSFDNLVPHDLPGYGMNLQDDDDQFGFNYYLYWRIPFRKNTLIKEDDN